jgi:hypothetical protein
VGGSGNKDSDIAQLFDHVLNTDNYKQYFDQILFPIFTQDQKIVDVWVNTLKAKRIE